jgi:hypothetical protein
MPTTPDTSTAVAREAAWLTTSGDGLPALLATAGGPFDVVQGYQPRTPPESDRCLFLTRSALNQHRFGDIRKMTTFRFRLWAWWPVLDVGGDLEREQQALDTAIELVLQRIGGLLLDKTHGGRFLSAAENPAEVEVQFHDAAQTVPISAALVAEISYSVDDWDFNG